jgi:hypothetical protein
VRSAVEPIDLESLDEPGSYLESLDEPGSCDALLAYDAVSCSEAPTLPPLPHVRDVRDQATPLEELLYRFEVGDHRGALAAAETLLDQRLAPTMIVPWEVVPSLELSPTATLLLTLVDGRTPLEALLDVGMIPMIDALRALCELLEQRVVVLR